jgi:hypothetical protein
METSAAALTTTAPAAPPAEAGGAGATGAADFLALLTGSDPATAAKAGRKPATPIKPKATPGETLAAPKPENGRAEVTLAGTPVQTVKAARAASDKPSALAAADLAAAAQLPQQNALPAALLAALTAGAGAAAAGTAAVPPSDAATPEPAAATDAPRGKAKAGKAPGVVAARHESGDKPGKTAAAEPEATSPKVDPAAAPSTKPLEAVRTAAAKAEEILTPTPAAAAPGGQDKLAASLAAPQDGHTTETRIPLARDVGAQAALAAPVLALRVTTKDGALRTIEIRLDPVELGQVDVKLETGSDGKLKAVLSAENSQSFELLKREGGILENALRDAGVELGADGITFTLNEQGPGQGHSGAEQREAAYGGAAARRDTAAAEQLAADTAQKLAWRSGVIDISA